jgi:cell division protein FtsA
MKSKKIITGIDIGSQNIITIIGMVDEEENLSVIGVAHSDSKGIRKGQIVDIEEATSAIVTSLESAERMAGYQVSHAFISVGGTHISSMNSHGVVAVQDPTKEIVSTDIDRVIDAAKAVSLGAGRKIIHVLPRYFIVDSQEGIKDPVGMSGIRLEVDTHIIAGGLTSLKNLEKSMDSIGVSCSGFVFNGFASAESVLTETEKELGVVLLDIGAGTTDIAIYVEGALSYSSVLPVGARNVTNDIAIGLRISLESAEKLKLYLGKLEKQDELTIKQVVSPEEKKKKKDYDKLDISSLNLPELLKTIQKKTVVDGIIKPRLNEIFSLVSAEIKKSSYAGLVPAGLVVTGGGAQTVGISHAAMRTIALPFRIGIPQELKGISDEVSSPSYSTSVGLLKYGLKVQPQQSNFTFGRLSNPFKNAPIKTSAEKIANFVKSLLP